MTFRVELDKKSLKKLEKDLEHQQHLFEQNLLAYMGAEAVSLIRDRVAKGIGSDDKPMEKYSPSYEAYKKSKGRDTSKRDLVFSGRMMGSVTVDGPFQEANGSHVIVTFGGGPSIQIQASKNEERTPFFGLSKKDTELLKGAVERFMKAYFERNQKR